VTTLPNYAGKGCHPIGVVPEGIAGIALDSRCRRLTLHSVHRRTCDPEPTRDLSRPDAVGLELKHAKAPDAVSARPP
jgi:hypothetical protein